MSTSTFLLTLRTAEEQGFVYSLVAGLGVWALGFCICIPRTLVVRALTIRAVVLSIVKIDYKKLILTRLLKP